MDLTAIILQLYPTAIPLVDFTISRTFIGEPTISRWNTAKLGAQPTAAKLDTAWPSVQLGIAKAAQSALIKSAFLTASTANVTDANGIAWEGGMASGNSIFLGCQLAQQMGQTSITLFDAAKAPHSMTIAEGMSVAALIGSAYQTALGQKNALYAQIDAATTVSAVQTVVWP